MERSLLDTLHKFQIAIQNQYNEVLEWVENEIKSDDPDRTGISQKMGFMAALQAYSQITDHYIEEWNFVSEEDFGKAIAIAGDQFRSYISEAHIIPNDADWFEGVKSQLTEKLDKIIHDDEFLDDAVEISLHEYNDIVVDEIRAGFDVAKDFIKNLNAGDLDMQLSPQSEDEINEKCERAEREGNQVLDTLLKTCGLRPK